MFSFFNSVNFYKEITKEHVDLDKIKDILKTKKGKSQIDKFNEFGDTPLCAAVRKRDIVLVQLLIDNGANINLARVNLPKNESNRMITVMNVEEGYTPLHYAVLATDAFDYNLNKSAIDEGLKIAKLLLSNGADINSVSSCHNTFSSAFVGKSSVFHLMMQQISHHLPRSLDYFMEMLLFFIKQPQLDITLRDQQNRSVLEYLIYFYESRNNVEKLKLINLLLDSMIYSLQKEDKIKEYRHHNIIRNSLNIIKRKITEENDEIDLFKERACKTSELIKLRDEKVHTTEQLEKMADQYRIRCDMGSLEHSLERDKEEIKLLNEKVKLFEKLSQHIQERPEKMNMAVITHSMNDLRLFHSGSSLKNDFLSDVQHAEEKLISTCVAEYLFK